MNSLLEQARLWLTEDPDPETRSELQELLDSDNEPAIAERFGPRLDFGTAGIRGVLGAGPGRMNRANVRLVTAGLAKVLLEQVPGAAARGVVVGRDARILSPELASDVCAVLAGSGIRVHSLEDPGPTPLLAFAVLELGAAAGVMITASHNPPEYNGYKVYWENGAQIIPPFDREVSAAAAGLRSLAEVPWTDLASARSRGLLVPPPSDLEDRYLESLDRYTFPSALPAGAPDPLIVYTPLHGVALGLVARVFERRGFRRLRVVAAQAQPDGRFPTVRFPNPEESDALGFALEQARVEGAVLVLANDPDGDRLAAIVRDEEGSYQTLTGDQIGCLLGHHILASRRDTGRLPPQGFVVNTIVSSNLLARIAESFGVRCERVLTGLKWIWNRALELEAQGGAFLFGYEEALGYSVSPSVRDKDGISAAILLAEIARLCAAEGRTLLDRLDELYQEFGVFLTRQVSIQLSSLLHLERTQLLLGRLRENPPDEVAGKLVLRLCDWQGGRIWDRQSGRNSVAHLPSSQVLQLDLEGDCRISFRPSGTEPKLKVYLEASEPPDGLHQLAAAKRRILTVLDHLEAHVRGLLGSIAA